MSGLHTPSWLRTHSRDSGQSPQRTPFLTIASTARFEGGTGWDSSKHCYKRINKRCRYIEKDKQMFRRKAGEKPPSDNPTKIIQRNAQDSASAASTTSHVILMYQFSDASPAPHKQEGHLQTRKGREDSDNTTKHTRATRANKTTQERKQIDRGLSAAGIHLRHPSPRARQISSLQACMLRRQKARMRKRRAICSTLALVILPSQTSQPAQVRSSDQVTK